MLFDPSAIIRKYVGKRSVVRNNLSVLDRNISDAMKPSIIHMVNRKFCKTQLRTEVSAFYVFMFANYRNPRHPLIQTYYIMLWANVDIHFAMNYVLSAYCTAFDEVAVVSLLKQLTVCSGADGIYFGIIKAIWDRLFHHDVIREAVLHYSNRNVASYSLMTLAVHDPEMDTFERLLVEAIDAYQNITLAVYNTVLSFRD